MIGGPLHRLGRRMGLVREGGDTILLGVALGLFAWTVLVLLALLGGIGPKVFSLGATGVHVRLLLAIPLTAAMKALCDHVGELKPYGRLLGD